MDPAKLIISNYIIYGDDRIDLVPDFVHFERMEDSRRRHQGDIKPHVHSNIFQLYFIENGSLDFTSNELTGTISGKSIVLIPENILHGVQLHDGTTGAVLNVSQQLLEKLFEKDPSTFMTINEIRTYEISSGLDFMKRVVDKIEHELLQRDKPNSQVVQALLILLFNEIYRGIRSKNASSGKSPVDHSHFSKFIRLVKLNGTAEKKLQGYADDLGISTTHLNRICKATVGKRASEVIKDYIILEAKRHLKFTSHTVSEIAYLLEFANPSYFNRYFKKQVGMTPKMYRNTG